MNWYITTTTDDPSSLTAAEPTIERAEDEDEALQPNATLVDDAKTAAQTLAIDMQSNVLITIQGHEEQVIADEFHPGYVTVTVSLVDPAAAA